MVLPLEKEKKFSIRQIINPETLKIKWMFNTSSNNSLASSVSPLHGKWIKGRQTLSYHFEKREFMRWWIKKSVLNFLRSLECTKISL